MAKRSPKHVFARRIGGDPGLTEKLLDIVGRIPTPREALADDPPKRARALARAAAAKSAASAGTLALPPGPLGWLTIAPELYAVWKIQAQMVADIAGAYGKPELLTREQMLYSLFSHTAAGAFRDLVIRVGERYVVRRAPLSALYAIGNKVAIRVAQRSAGRVLTRWVPALGALGVAGYVYIDTGRVADTSIDLFGTGVLIDGELEVDVVNEMADMEAEAQTPKRSRAKKGADKPKKPAPKKSATKKTPVTKSAAKKTAKKASPRQRRARDAGETTS